MKTCIIVPCYNRIQFTKISLPHLLSMLVLESLVVAVDDGSDDGTGEWLKSLTNKRLNAVLHGENKGLPVAYNSGFEFAKNNGCGIAIIVDNDVLVPYGFDGVLSEDVKDCDVICGGFVCNDKNVVRWARTNYSQALPPMPVETTTIGGGSALAVPVTIWDDAGGFDAGKGSFAYTDTKFLGRARKLGYKVMTNPNVMCYELQGFAYTDIEYEKTKFRKRYKIRTGLDPVGEEFDLAFLKFMGHRIKV